MIEQHDGLAQGRAIVIEDEQSIGVLTRAFLKAADIEADVVATGAAALPRLGTTRYNLAIVDLGLPDLPGRGLVDFLAHLWPDVAILVVTGNLVDEMENCDALLRKPFTRQMFLAAVSDAMSAHREHQRNPVGRRSAVAAALCG